MDRILVLEGEHVTRAALTSALKLDDKLDACFVGTQKEAVAAFERERFELAIVELLPSDPSLPEFIKRLIRTPTLVTVVAAPDRSHELARKHSELASIDLVTAPVAASQLVLHVRQRLADRKLSSPPDSAFTVSDYLQLAGMARRSLIIHVENAETEGQIVVQNGTPVWARDRDGVGTAAFQRLALLSRADVNCQPCTTWSTKSNLEGSLEQLLLDAARRSDESKKRQHAPGPALEVASPPPPSTPVQRAVPRPNPPPLRRERPESSTQKEKSMSPDSSKPPESQRILTGVPAISAIACADQEGSVLDYAGSFDAETACAVATIASRPINDIVSELGLGDLQSWCVSMGENTWYVVHQARQMYVAQGAANKNPTTVLRKVEAGCRGQQ